MWLRNFCQEAIIIDAAKIITTMIISYLTLYSEHFLPAEHLITWYLYNRLLFNYS